jgi:hypothetical protein
MPVNIAEQRIHILGEEIATNSSPTVSVPSAFLATEHWVDLVDTTDKDRCEYGYAVGTDRQSEPVLSDRLEGYAAITGEDGAEIEQASLSAPIFPFGILRARQIKKAVLVHTHPMPISEDRPRTRIFSDKDIGHFFGSDYLAMIMLDQGGAHLMAKKERFTRNARDLLHPKLVETTLLEVREGSRSMRDVLSKVAYQLWVHGVGYYYTPDLLQPDDTVEFQNLRQAKAVLTPSA